MSECNYYFTVKYGPAKSIDRTCADEGLIDITTKEDCEVACAALGRVGNKDGENFEGEWEYKGPQCFMAVKGTYVGNYNWNNKTDGTQCIGLNFPGSQGRDFYKAT